MLGLDCLKSSIKLDLASSQKLGKYVALLFDAWGGNPRDYQRNASNIFTFFVPDVAHYEEIDIKTVQNETRVFISCCFSKQRQR